MCFPRLHIYAGRVAPAIRVNPSRTPSYVYENKQGTLPESLIRRSACSTTGAWRRVRALYELLPLTPVRAIATCAQLKDERAMSAFVIDPEASMRLNAAPVLAGQV